MAHRVVLFERVYAQLKANPYGQAKDVTITFNVYGDHTEVLTNLENEHEWESYLTRFRQLTLSDDHVALDHMLRELPRYVDDAGLRQRLGQAHDVWKAAQGVPSQLAPMVLGRFAPAKEMARLYLYGGIIHTDPELSDIWESMTPNEQTFVKHQFRLYESKVRNVIITVHEVIKEALAKGLFTEEPLDLRAEPASKT
jgi:hypothetical protein